MHDNFKDVYEKEVVFMKKINRKQNSTASRQNYPAPEILNIQREMEAESRIDKTDTHS